MKYLKITHPDIENGPGCRVTLWIPGCCRLCPECQNAWTHSYNQGLDFTTDEFDEICRLLERPEIAGLTISGGDPLMQLNDVLIDLCQLTHDIKERFPDKTIWLYTGYWIKDLNELQRDVLHYCDVVVEGPYEHDKRDTTLPFRGSLNQKITYLQ
jgi:anaerobic ribonucleoside-triphosphate reductase activating protein